MIATFISCSKQWLTVRLIPGYSLGRENLEGVMCLLEGVGASVRNISEIARKLVKVGHAAREIATIYSVTFCY